MAPKQPEKDEVAQLLKDFQIAMDLLKLVDDFKRPIALVFEEPAREWVVDVPNKSIKQGKAVNPEITLTFKEKDFKELLAGNVQPAQAFMSGKIKLKGNLTKLMKLQALQPRLEALRARY